MALIHCPDCRNDVSDRAQTCPYCAYPIGNLTTLHQAVTAGDRAMIEDLLKAGVDVDSADTNGSTPLMIAAYSGSLDIVERLVQAGAKSNVQRRGGNTALMDAAYKGDSRIVRILLAANADFQLRNEAGQSALDIARRKKRKEAQLLLEQALVKQELDEVVQEATTARHFIDHKNDEHISSQASELDDIVNEATAEEINDNIDALQQEDDTKSQPLKSTEALKNEEQFSIEKEPVEVEKAQETHPPVQEVVFMKCLECDAAIHPEDIACANCKTLIVRRYCSRCSRLIPEHTEICPYCGTNKTSVLRNGMGIQKIAIAICVIVAVFIFLTGRNSGQEQQKQTQQPAEPHATAQQDRMPPSPPEPIAMLPADQHTQTEMKSDPQAETVPQDGEKNRTESSPAVISTQPNKRKSVVAVSNQTKKRPAPAVKSTPSANKTSKLNSLLARGSGEPPIHKSIKTARRLNALGYRLMRQARYEQAVIVLRQSLQAYPTGSKDLVYAYALYNLGRSLRLAGHPDAAVPILEERMKINNQRDVVARELQAAKRDLGDPEAWGVKYE